jgi:hypothetical protein
MLFFLSFSTLSNGHIFGNEVFLISEKQHADLYPKNSSFIFQAPLKLQIDIKETEKKRKKSGPVQEDQFIQISNTSAQLRSYSENIGYLLLWHIPLSLCPSGSAYYSADRLINFRTENPNVKRDFCVFPQTDVMVQDVAGKFVSNSSYCRLEFYQGNFENHVYVANIHHKGFHRLLNSHLKVFNTTGVKDPSYVFQSDTIFQVSFYTPFFMRFTNCTGYSLNTTFESTVMRDNSLSFDCTVDSIPVITKSGGMKMGNPLGYVEVTKCENAAANVTFSFFLASGALAMFSIVLVLLFIVPSRSSAIFRSYTPHITVV